MPLGDLPFNDSVLKSLGRCKGSQHVGDGRSGFAQSLSELLLGEVIRFHQELVRARGLDRVQIGALEVLDERELEAIPYLVTHYRWDRGFPGESGREDAPMAGDKLVASAVRRYHNRLQNAVARDGRRELGKAFGVESRPRLMTIRPYKLKWDLAR